MQKIEYIETSKLIPDSNNPRKIDEHQFDILCQSIKDNPEYFETRPILYNKNFVVFAGNMRLRAAIKLGIEKVPSCLLDVSEEKQKEIMLRDNRSNGFWDWELLAGLFSEEELKNIGFSEEELGFDLGLDDFKEDDVPETPDKAQSKLGDVYELGPHRVICGDSLSPEVYERLLSDEKVNLLFTDPPYGVSYSSGSVRGDKSKHKKIENDDLKKEELTTFISRFLEQTKPYLADDACFYIWHATSTAWEFREAIVRNNLDIHQTIIWIKPSFTLTRADYQHTFEPCFYGWQHGKTHYTNGKIRNFKDIFSLNTDDFRDQLDLWYAGRDQMQSYVHPTQKPVKLAGRALIKSSKKGDVVLDPFGESGSTLIACEQGDRKARLIELSPNYVDVIVSRYCKFTGNNQITKNGKAIEWHETDSTKIDGGAF